MAVAAGLQVFSPTPTDQADIVVAARNLPGGHVLVADDLAIRRVDPDAVPQDSMSDVEALIGRRLAAPVTGAEPLTAVRLLGRSALHDYDRELGGVAVMTPVRISDAGGLVLLHPGDRVDVLAVPATESAGGGAAPESPGAGGGARVVLASAPVLAVQPTATADGTDRLADSGAPDGPAGSGLIVLATTDRAAVDLAGAAAGATVSVVLRPRG